MSQNVKPSGILSKALAQGYLVAAACLALLVFIALFSYDSTDNSWLVASAAPHSNNLLGSLGSQLASILLWLLGFAAYLLPVLGLAWAIFVYKQKLITKSASAWLLLKACGLLVLLLSVAGLFNLFNPFDNYKLPSSNGGIIGAAIAAKLGGSLNLLGAIISLVSTAMIALTMAIGLVWLQALKIAVKVGARTVMRSIYIVFSYIKYHYRLRKNIRASMQQPIWEASVLPEELRSQQDNLPDLVRQQPKLRTIKTILPSLKNSNLASGYLPASALLQPSASDLKVENYSVTVLNEMSRDLEAKLQDFGVQAKVCAVCPGPVITRFELVLVPGMKASKVSGLAKDLARQLAVPAVRVVELIPGKSVIGLEIPNKNRELVRLRDIIESKAYRDSAEPLTLALGKDIAGKPLIANLARMPHLLVAGSTGSGKSVAINVMLLSLLYKTTPADVRLLLIDPKMLELAVYDGIGHLLAPVVTDMREAAGALRWCVEEMERRYKLMSDLGVRNLAGYNEKLGKSAPADKLPYIVIMIDEFADLMITVGKEVEELITRITQKARAAGIHMILATQRPSVDVITGLIKANVPTRIAFQVASRIDSRTILDQQGAEQLLGQGDLLYLAPGAGIPIRVHGALVGDEEVHAVVQAIKEHGLAPEYLIDLSNEVMLAASSDEVDTLYETAVRIVLDSRKTSVSYLQRKLKIGYNRAARLIEEMESSGILSQLKSNGLREIL